MTEPVIFEYSRRGRRAQAQAPAAMAADRSARVFAAQDATAAARGLGAADGAPLYPAVEAQFLYRYALLSAGFVHDEIQPAGLQHAGHAAGLSWPASAGTGESRPGFPGVPVRAAGDAQGRHRDEGGVADADGGRPGRVCRRRHDPRLSSGARRYRIATRSSCPMRRTAPIRPPPPCVAAR